MLIINHFSTKIRKEIDDEKRIFHGDGQKNLHLPKKKINQCV